MEFNLADLFEAVVDTVPDAEALVCGGADGDPASARTYAELDDRAEPVWPTCSAGWASGRDDHVGLHLHNGPEFIEAMLACYKLRAVPVNVNYRYVADELRYLFADAGLRAVVTEPRPGRAGSSRSAAEPARPRCHRSWSDPAYDRVLAAQPAGRVDVGPARPTTATCSTPAARPVRPRASCGATRTSTSPRSAAGARRARASRS